MRECFKDDLLRQIRYGKENARTGAELAKVAGLKTDRGIRIGIRALIASGVPIASSVGNPVGYYIAKTQEEAEEYMKVMLSRLVHDAYRRRDFKHAADKILHPAQLELL